MASTDVSGNTSTEIPEAGTIDMKLEVVTLPVSDVDRAKRFYQSLGWRMDADIVVGGNFRAVQLTPLHSQCSVAFGKGLTTAEPGSVQRLLVAVSDMDAREHGSMPDEASQAAGRYMEEVLHVAAL
jgi:catechol 2,3-dioxygenase-like lactoylglutathione lyase family enzyme